MLDTNEITNYKFPRTQENQLEQLKATKLVNNNNILPYRLPRQLFLPHLLRLVRLLLFNRYMQLILMKAPNKLLSLRIRYPRAYKFNILEHKRALELHGNPMLRLP